ncbi:WD40 repeat protein [Geobacter argillaceus]|uniref:WD40 repeat protein n=1 Tax=Geobacter argillaceus TaxID=345631 RepID=A0A562WRC7_9BACT|nr:WD40 repeat protein [Geobacter argillaceus]
MCIAVFLSVTGCRREQKESHLQPPGDVVTQTTLLATIGDREKPHSVDYAAGNKAVFNIVFNERGRGVAYIAEIAGTLHVVHDGTIGRPYQAIDNLQINPDGQRIAYSASVNGKRCPVTDGREGQLFDDTGVPVFSPDGRHVAHKVIMGGKIHIVVDNELSDGYRAYGGNPVFSADSAKVAYVEGAEENRKTRLIVSDLAFKKKIVKESCGSLMVTNRDKTRIAAINDINNKQRVIVFGFDRPDAMQEGPLYDSIEFPAFGKDGDAVAYVAKKGEARVLVLNGQERPLPEGDLIEAPVVHPDRKKAGIIMAIKHRYFLHEPFSHDEPKEKQYDEAAELVYNRDGSRHAYTARNGKNWFLVVNGKEGPAFDRVVTPMFSPDGSRLIYRARKDGKRFVVVADANGVVMRQHPNYEMVFPPVFTADGKSVAYGVKDGQQLIWKVENL